MNPTNADMDLAASLWSAEATKARGCTCAAVDIGVGDLHEPGCGDPRPEDVAVLIARAREEERAVILARLDAHPRVPNVPLVLFDDVIRRIVRGAP